MIGINSRRTRPGIVASRASVRGGWVKDQRNHRRPAHYRRPGRNLQFKTATEGVSIALRGAPFFQEGRSPGLSTLETCLWPMLIPVEIAEVVPRFILSPATPSGSSGKVFSVAPAESGEGVSVTCDVTRGVVEVHDPRLLHRGRETFCRALVMHAVKTAGAIRAGLSLTSSTSRFEFTPGSVDRVQLAERVALAIRAATRDASDPPVPGRKQLPA
jgi:hypothetical protein